MRPKKSMLKAYLVTGAIFYLFIIYFALHYTIVSDLAKGLTELGTGIRISTQNIVSNMSGAEGIFSIYGSGTTNPISLFFAASDHIVQSPFNFDGLIISHVFVPLFAITFFAACCVGLYVSHRMAFKQDAPGKEKGSAHWFSDFKTYNKNYVTPWTKQDKKEGFLDNNCLLAEGLKLSMDARWTKRNLNILVVGGSGTGKTFGFIKPNLAQMNASFVTTDPSGEIMQVMGIPLMEHGYQVKLFSTSDMRHSNCYNPMDYIYDADGSVNQTKVGVLVSTFLRNATENQKKGGGDPFWEKSSKAWMTFAVLFLAQFALLQERNMHSILKLAQQGKADEDSSSSETILDKIVKAKRIDAPNAACWSSYDTFKLAPAKTANSILISIAVDLNPFAMDDVRNMTTTSYVCNRNKNGEIVSYNKDKNGQLIRDSKNLDLDQIGDRPTAVFINIPQANSAYNFLVSMMYSQMFDQLYYVAEKVSPNSYHIYDGRGNILASQFPTEEAANRMLELYKGSIIKKVTRDKVDHFYLYNKEAKKETPLEFEADKKLGKGYLKEVYSEKVGLEFIKRCSSIPVVTRKPIKFLGLQVGEKRSVIKKQAYVKQGKLRLPIHVRFLLDEFSNIGEIPNFDKMLSTMRKYEISCTIILQSLAQIKAQYDKIWEVIVGNCDTKVFLGSSENETTKYMSEILGKATIRTIDTSQSKSATSGSLSTSFKKDGRELMTPSELANMDNDHCIVVIRGMDPFYMRKLSFARHPNFKETGDYDPKKVIGNQYLEDHFRCLPQNSVQVAETRKEEDQNKEDFQTKKKQDRAKANRKPITSNRGKQVVANEMGTTEMGVEKAMEQATEIPKQEFQMVPNDPVIPAHAPLDELPFEDPLDQNTTTELAKPKRRVAKKSKKNAPLNDGQNSVENNNPTVVSPDESANNTTDSTTKNEDNAALSSVPNLPTYNPVDGQVGPETASDDSWAYF